MQFEHRVPPHPGPLPKERESFFDRAGKLTNRRPLIALPNSSPSPQGRGPGCGGTARPTAQTPTDHLSMNLNQKTSARLDYVAAGTEDRGGGADLPAPCQQQVSVQC